MSFSSLIPSTEEDLIREWMDTRCNVALQDTVLKGIKETGLSTAAQQKVECRIDPNEVFPDGSGRSLLHLVLQYPPYKENQSFQTAYAAAIVEFGADLNFQDAAGVTPIMLAAASPTVHYSTFRLLLGEKGINLRLQGDEGVLQDKTGRTALFHAIEAGRPEYVRLLANEIVHHNLFSVFLLRNNDGETAEDVAERLKDLKSKKIVSKKRVHLLESVNKGLRKSGQGHASIATVAVAKRAASHWEQVQGPSSSIRTRSTSVDNFTRVPRGGRSGFPAGDERISESLEEQDADRPGTSQRLTVPLSASRGSSAPHSPDPASAAPNRQASFQGSRNSAVGIENLLKKLEVLEEAKGSASRTRVLKSMFFPREVAKALCHKDD